MEIKFCNRFKTLFILGILLFKPVLAIEQKSFFKTFNQFSSKVCTPVSEQTYDRLFKEYKNNPISIPLNSIDEIDQETVSWVLKEIDFKLKWLEVVSRDLKKIKNFQAIEKNLKVVEDKLNKLVELKSLRIKSNSKNDLSNHNKEKKEYKILKKEFNRLISKVFFLKSYSFPVDHLKLRAEYDALKNESNVSVRRNKLYLLRKMTEDGVSSGTSFYGDALTRTLINSLYLRLNSESTLIETNRYDLVSLIEKLKKEFEKGKRYQEEKIEKWLSRTQIVKSFYSKLRDNQVALEDEVLSYKEYKKQKQKQEDSLRSYVLKKQAETYQFWAKQSLEKQSMYVMLTILFNEVGRVERNSSVERRDIVELIQNRYEDLNYSRIPASHELASHFHEERRSRWLDVLFKEGEFSFTYFYIPSVTRTFCPDMSYAGKKLRNENFNIIKSQIAKKNKFDGLRYFSRVSMIGRIDMSEIWTDYEPIFSPLGARVRGPASLVKEIKQDHYLALEEFLIDREPYRLIEVKNNHYVLRQKDHALFRYRDQSVFQFFKPKIVR